MARTNLAEIDTTLEAAVEREYQAPRLAAMDTLKPIAGFWLPDPEETEKRLTSRRNQVNTYRQRRDEFRAQLERDQVQPLAMLPQAAWHRICRDSGLYRLRPTDDDGSIRIDTAVGGWFEGFAILAVIALVGSLITAFIWSGVAFLSKDTHALNICYALMSVGFLIIGVVSLVAAFDVGIGPIPWLHEKITIGLVHLGGLLPHRWWLRLLLPKFTEPPASTDFGRSAYATIALPTPPAAVADILQRVASKRPYVAAVADAIAFRDPMHEVLHIVERHDKRMQAWRERPRHYDPIIYLEQNGVVAILAQFGDFPIEQEVVARVAASEALL